MFEKGGAQERTRTSTSIQTPAPEAGASTNSATWAGHVWWALRGCVQPVNVIPARLCNFAR